jgi:hypothetical protein
MSKPFTFEEDMSGKQVEIDKLEFWTRAEWASVRPDKSASEAFGPPDPEWIENSITCFRSSIKWAWLKWHLEPKFDPISDALSRVVSRCTEALSTRKVALDEEMRGFHDSLMMHCAILSGNAMSMRVAAENVIAATQRARKYQYDAAIAGVLAYHVLGDSTEEKRQLGVADQFKPNRIDPFPSRSLSCALVERDFPSLVKEVIRGVKKHWSESYLGKKGSSRAVVILDDPQRIVLDIRRKNSYYLWPYVEASFAKHAIIDGADFAFDDFWLPLGLVHTRIDGGALVPNDAGDAQKMTRKQGRTSKK